MTHSLEHVRALSPRLRPEFLEEQRLIPLQATDDAVLVGTWGEPARPDAVWQLEALLGCNVLLEPVDEDAARHAIRRVYGEASARSFIDAMGAGASQGTAGDEPAIDDLRALANEAPVIRLVSLLLTEALAARASDVHLEAYPDALRIRYRVDGALEDAPSPPPAMARAIVSRLKVMADLDIAERRVPQDGRIRLVLQDRQVDVRVATVPTLHGESVVLRLLDRASGTFELEALGMSDDTLRQLRAVLARPHGIVLATGPTGSGKTTTLYAALAHLRTGREKIVTVEDPVEYQLAGVPQVPVNERAGVTFASALRALLRQDPDVLLVGEIRDGETAEIATQAALTGHLVLSTLHTNDAAGAITRLIDLGVPPFLVSATLEAVLAQRLVRTICGACAGNGCDACRGSGYLGRTGVYELLVVTEAMREAITSGAGAQRIRELAAAGGMRDLSHDAARLVREGRTTPEEALRIGRENI